MEPLAEDGYIRQVSNVHLKIPSGIYKTPTF